MSGLVDKIKDKVRRRSSSSVSRKRSSSIYEDAQPMPDLPSDSNYHTGSNFAQYHSSSPRVSLENSAFHVHRGRKSLDVSHGRNIPQQPAEQNHGYSRAIDHFSGPPTQAGNLNSYQTIPNRHTGASDGRYRPQESQNQDRRSFEQRHLDIGRVDPPQNVVEEMVPARSSSKQVVPSEPQMHSPTSPKRKPVNYSYPDPRHTAEPSSPSYPTRISSKRAPDAQRDVQGRPDVPVLDKALPRAPDAYDTRREARPADSVRLTRSGGQDKPKNSSTDLALSAKVAELYLDQRSNAVAKEKAISEGHMRLPQGFSLQDTEATYVTEEQRPAVTHETIIKQRTEIFREEITRDIHVHHYYTYEQPVKVLEILPTKHYTIDSVTGIKTEIPAPADWQLPANMQPISPDTSMLKATTRHYLVDEEHPRGVLEPPPPKRELGTEDLRQEANVARQI